MKHFTLKYIQIAWVSELIVIILYTMMVVPFLGIDRITLWLQFLPLFGALIGAQAIAATGGPLAADAIKKANEHKEA